MNRARIASAFLAVVLLGCGGQTPAVEQPRATPIEIVRARDGAALTEAALFAELAAAPVVYVGEEHDRSSDHEAERRVAEAMSSADAGPFAIGMEMVQAPFQPVLDAWSTGTLDEAGLLSGIEWQTRWRIDFALYRSIFELARDRHLTLVALNLPRELTRAIARTGLDSLTETQRVELPDLDTSDAEHRAFVLGLLGEHPGHEGASGMDAAMLDRMYLAQLAWDEAMGAAVASYLAVHPDTRLMVMAGRAHVERGLGIPRRAERRGAPHGVIVLPVPRPDLDEALAAHAADYFWLTD